MKFTKFVLLYLTESGLINNNANTTFNFVAGKTYRLRLINMSALAMFYFSIDNHTMDVIEVEGVSGNIWVDGPEKKFS